MSSSMYELTVPVLTRTLSNLKGVLLKGVDYIATQKLNESDVFNARLAQDMLPLCSQVRIVTDFSKGCVFRLSGQAPPSIDDDETDFAGLLARIDKVQALVKGFEPGQLNGTEQDTMTVNTPFGELSFPGQDYVLHFVYPNLFFHATTAYAILRHQGVPLGKLDFLGAR